MSVCCFRFAQSDGVLGNCPERHAPPSGTRLAARRQRKVSISAWLRGVVLFWRFWCAMDIGKFNRGWWCI